MQDTPTVAVIFLLLANTPTYSYPQVMAKNILSTKSVDNYQKNIQKTLKKSKKSVDKVPKTIV